MSVRMRHTSGHTKNRRSHHSLTEPRLSKCAKCGSFHLRHRACEICGKYRGRQVIDVQGKIEKKNERKKAKMKELGKDPNAKQEEEKVATLDAKKLSKKVK